MVTAFLRVLCGVGGKNVNIGKTSFDRKVMCCHLCFNIMLAIWTYLLISR